MSILHVCGLIPLNVEGIFKAELFIWNTNENSQKLIKCEHLDKTHVKTQTSGMLFFKNTLLAMPIIKAKQDLIRTKEKG